MVPRWVVLLACLINLPDAWEAQLAAELIDGFLPIGKKWTIVAAVKHGFDRLAVRLCQVRPTDITERLRLYHDFNRAVAFALRIGNVNLAKTLVQTLQGARLTTGVHVAARFGILEFLEWIHSHSIDACWGGLEMTKSVRFGHLNVLEWLQANTVRLGRQKLLGLAAKHHSSDILKWVLAVREERPVLSDLAAAAENGCLGNLQILSAVLHSHGQLDVTGAAKQGHLHVVQWLHENGGSFSSDVLDGAAEYGHLDVLIWLYQHRRERCSFRAIERASRNGHISVVKWLHSRRTVVPPTALHMAILGGHLKLAQWLHASVDMKWEGDVVDSAARYGSRAMVVWIYNLYPGRCTNAAMDNAALVGNNELFYWLHFVAHQDCTTSAMDYFAASGDIDMLDWMEKVRHEGFTAAAMDLAATNGHLTTVKWLHERRAPCTVKAMDGAAEGGHLDIVKYLSAHRLEGCSTDALDCD